MAITLFDISSPWASILIMRHFSVIRMGWSTYRNILRIATTFDAKSSGVSERTSTLVRMLKILNRVVV